MGRIAGVVLAAGASRRLGRPKQLLPLGGKPVLTHVLHAARAAGLSPILVVLGHSAGEIQRIIDAVGLAESRPIGTAPSEPTSEWHDDRSAVVVVENPRYAEGLSTSVQLAARHLPPDVDAAVFLLGDQPLVDPAVIRRLADAYRAHRAPIVQPRYAEGRGNPVLIARDLFPELEQLTGDTGARPLLERHAHRVHLVDARDYRRPADIDTWEDYERVQAEFRQSGGRGSSA